MSQKVLLWLGLALFAACSSPGAGGDGGATDDGSDAGPDAGGNDGSADATDGDDAQDGTDGGGEGDGGDGAGDGSSDPCAGMSACACLSSLLDDPQRCAPEKSARLAQAVELIATEKKAPCPGLTEAIFVYAGPASSVTVAGEFNAWTGEALERLCGLNAWARRSSLPGRYSEYKLVIDDAWKLDPANRAFAYDDFAGNPDQKNSVANIPGSNRSHLEWWPGVSSAELGNARDLFVYVPANYRPEEARTYPVIYMHDGQNIFDDSSCCFGSGGWQVNLAADQEIVFGNVAPFFVVGIANTAARLDEYTPCLDTSQGEPFGGKAEAYERFVLEVVMPLMEDAYRIDPAQRAIAGSSLGGTISMFIALRHPELFRRGVGSLSGAFWVCQDSQQAVHDQVSALPGRLDLPIYLDSGGDVSSNADGAADTLEVRNLLQAKGFSVSDAPPNQPCAENVDVCYYLEPDAPHNEIAWRERVWHMIRFLE